MSEITVSKGFNISLDIKDRYSIEDTYSSKLISYPYKFSELNTISYSSLNTKKYNNFLYAYTKSYIDIVLSFITNVNEVIICNKLV